MHSFNTESQWIIEQLWSKGPLLIILPAAAEPPIWVAQDSVQVAFQYLQRKRLHNFSGQPVITCPDDKKHFLVFRRNLSRFNLWSFHKEA